MFVATVHSLWPAAGVHHNRGYLPPLKLEGCDVSCDAASPFIWSDRLIRPDHRYTAERIYRRPRGRERLEGGTPFLDLEYRSEQAERMSPGIQMALILDPSFHLRRSLEVVVRPRNYSIAATRYQAAI